MAITVEFDDAEEQRAVFDKMKVGARVTMDFVDTSIDSTLVTLVDKYGIHWYLNYSK